MNDDFLYKDYVIRCESFQREEQGTWVPQYTVTRQDDATKVKVDFPSHQYQFNHAYLTQSEADEFVRQKAQHWIDKQVSQKDRGGALSAAN